LKQADVLFEIDNIAFDYVYSNTITLQIDNGEDPCVPAVNVVFKDTYSPISSLMNTISSLTQTTIASNFEILAEVSKVAIIVDDSEPVDCGTQLFHLASFSTGTSSPIPAIKSRNRYDFIGTFDFDTTELFSFCITGMVRTFNGPNAITMEGGIKFVPQ
jgi:hypothetical protein